MPGSVRDGLTRKRKRKEKRNHEDLCKAPCSKHKHVFMAKMVWRSWESTSFLVAVVIVGFVRPVCLDARHSSKKIKLSELYATLYHSLCRCLIPPLYTMFMPTTLCHIKYFVECFRWLLYAVLCCVIPM